MTATPAPPPTASPAPTTAPGRAASASSPAPTAAPAAPAAPARGTTRARRGRPCSATCRTSSPCATGSASSFQVQVTGSADGSVWGGDNGIYTDDSSVAAAAVHAGLLKNGETGVVLVRIVPPQDHYTGSNRNGVTSESWESWGGSFQLLGVQGKAADEGRGGYRGDGLKDYYPKPETGKDDGTAKEKDKTLLRLPERERQIDRSKSVEF